MSKFGETSNIAEKQETRKSPEVQLSVEKSDAEQCKQISDAAKKEVATAKAEGEKDLEKDMERAEKEGLEINTEEEKEFLKTDGELDVVEEELEDEIGGEKMDYKEVKAKEDFFQALSRGDLETVLKIGNEFPFPLEFMLTAEVRKAAQEGFPKILASGNFKDAFDIAMDLNFSEEFMQSLENRKLLSSPEAQEFIQYKFRDKLKFYNLDDAEKVIKTFDISTETFNKIIAEEFIEMVDNDAIERAIRIKKKFGISEELMSSHEIQKAARKVILEKVVDKFSQYETIIELKNELLVSDEIMTNVVREGFCRELAAGNNDAFEIKEKFGLSDEFLSSVEAQEAGKQAFIKQLSVDYGYERAFSIKDKLSLSDELLHLPEVQDVAKKELLLNWEKAACINFQKYKKTFPYHLIFFLTQ